MDKVFRIRSAHHVPPRTPLCPLASRSRLMELMVASGLLKPEIALGWKFNMPRDTPEQLRKIREKYMPDAVEDDE